MCVSVFSHSSPHSGQSCSYNGGNSTALKANGFSEGVLVTRLAAAGAVCIGCPPSFSEPIFFLMWMLLKVMCTQKEEKSYAFL